MTDLSQLSKNIKFYREKMRLTQRALADNLLVSFQAISAWERGQSFPDLENALRLAEFFDIPLDALVTEPELPCLVGIDGNTTTEFVLFKCNGVVERVFTGDGVNPTDVGIENAVKSLKNGLEIVLRGKLPKTIFAGIAGASRESYQKVIKAELESHFSAKTDVNTNAVNVLSLGKDPANSMAVMCRTSSCVYVRKGGASYRIGGWGRLVDHLGSAYDVGMDAIRHTLAVEDGMEGKSGLSRQVQQMMGGSVFDNISRINQNGRPYVAAFSQAVTRAGEQGDPLALQMLESNAAKLAQFIITALDRYGSPSQVIAVGRLLKTDIYREMVEKESGVKLELPEVSTVYGACVEAMRIAGLPLQADFYENFVSSYCRRKAVDSSQLSC